MNHDDTLRLLDADLVSLLTQIFALGYIDRMAGFQVADDDLIVGVDASAIEHMALDCIAVAEDHDSCSLHRKPSDGTRRHL